MTSYEFLKESKQAVAKYMTEKTGKYFDWCDVHTVWQCKTLQNHKGIFCTLTPDQLLFESTYNGDKDELYLDTYNKVLNQRFKHGELQTTLTKRLEGDQ